ncbi:MAG: hypothetical protein N2645_11945 [Clostridia bacterium]|nr:hypothetical protein [Clostridia bacterium]
MSYAYRLKCRVREDGFANTVRYIFHAASYCLNGFMRNTLLDFLYSGRSLNGNQKSLYKHLGANDTYHTDYSVMPLIFSQIDIGPQDVLVDVGCGKGRVINYWLSKKYTNKMIGLELDPHIANQTSKQFAAKKNVSVIPGDAISNLPGDGTIFYFYNPFSEEKVREFENKISALSKNRVIRIIYYNPKSIHVFNNGNWKIRFINFEENLGVKKWGRINKYHDLALITRSPEVHHD